MINEVHGFVKALDQFSDTCLTVAKNAKQLQEALKKNTPEKGDESAVKIMASQAKWLQEGQKEIEKIALSHHQDSVRMAKAIREALANAESHMKTCTEYVAQANHLRDVLIAHEYHLKPGDFVKCAGVLTDSAHAYLEQHVKFMRTKHDAIPGE